MLQLFFSLFRCVLDVLWLLLLVLRERRSYFFKVLRGAFSLKYIDIFHIFKLTSLASVQVLLVLVLVLISSIGLVVVRSTKLVIRHLQAIRVPLQGSEGGNKVFV